MSMKMPPLPKKRMVYRHMPDDYRYGDKYAYTEQQMRDYALAAVEAYKASLKPGLMVDLSKGTLAFVAVGSDTYRDGDLLYRLDGVEDER